MSMYLDHFGLREAPFRITPHTDFFFTGANRGETLDALIYAITRDEGIVKVSGEVGSGKTMLCRMLMSKLPPSVDTVYLANPLLARDDILYAIADELQASLPQERSSAVLRRLQELLIERYAQGKQVVVLVDEAHAMPAETLEEIRLLSNLESDRHKLLQMVLFGQPELDQILDRSEMRQLKDRITHHFNLLPLVRADVGAYIDFRMRAAGYRGPDVFTADAVRQIARASNGLTRRINILADKALLSAFSTGSHQVGGWEVAAARRDARYHSGIRWRRWAAAIGAATIATAIAAALWWWVRGVPESLPPQAGAAPKVSVEKPTPPVLAPSSVAPNQPEPGATTGPAQVATPGNTAESPPSPAPANLAPPATAEPTPAAASVATGIKPDLAPPERAVFAESAAAIQAPAPEIATANDTLPWGPLTRAHLDRTTQWLGTAAGERWFLQLLTADAADAAATERFIAETAATLDAAQLRAYEARIGKRWRLGVIYGEFATRADALAALKTLPAKAAQHGVYPRQVGRLR